MSSDIGSLHVAALRNETISFRIREYISREGLRIANETLVQAIQDEAINKNMPQRYIDGIWSDQEGEVIRIGIDFKGKELEPLDIFFEEGTKDHSVKPRIKKAITWITRGFRLFSKNNWVSGIEAKHVLQNGFAEGYPEFKEKLKEGIENELEEGRMFGRQD